METWSSVNDKEMQKIVEDYWKLFSRDYDKNDNTYYYQITCRILYEVNKWIERDTSLGPIVYSKLLDLNKDQDYAYRLKTHTLDMLQNTNSYILQTKLDLGEIPKIEKSQKTTDSSYRVALKYVISKLMQGNSEILYAASSYHTISLVYGDNHYEKVKVSISKDYCYDEQFDNQISSSQHKGFIPKFIEQYDYFIFINKETLTALIFSNKQLIDLLSKKEYINNYFNFHFHWFKDGTITDEISENPINVSDFNADKTRWKLPKHYMQK